MLDLKELKEILLFKEMHNVEREINTHPSPSFRRPLNYLETTTKVILRVLFYCCKGEKLMEEQMDLYSPFSSFILPQGRGVGGRKHTEPSARTLHSDG